MADDVLKQELTAQAGATTATPANPTAAATPATSPTSIATGNTSLHAYNTGRETQIRNVYDMARQNNLNALKTAYDQNMSNANAAREKITPQFQEGMNQLKAMYEQQRRNNNLQAQANNLNTGAGSQMQLGQMNVYNQNQAGMQKQLTQAINEADRGILELQTNYQNQISQAISNNDYQLAAALLDEYGNQYDRQMKQAQQLAEFGDFSLYTSIYGEGAAQNMEKSWMLQNPDLAYTLGKITRDEYFKMTGKWPHDIPTGGGGGSSGGGGYGYYPTGPNNPEPTSTYSALDAYKQNKNAGITGLQGKPTTEAQAAALLQEYNNKMAAHYSNTTPVSTKKTTTTTTKTTATGQNKNTKKGSTK